MKITKEQLKQIIKEEILNVLKLSESKKSFEDKQAECAKLKQGSDEKKKCQEELDAMDDEAVSAMLGATS